MVTYAGLADENAFKITNANPTAKGLKVRVEKPSTRPIIRSKHFLKRSHTQDEETAKVAESVTFA